MSSVDTLIDRAVAGESPKEMIEALGRPAPGEITASDLKQVNAARKLLANVGKQLDGPIHVAAGANLKLIKEAYAMIEGAYSKLGRVKVGPSK